MSLHFDEVDGVSFAPEASRILTAAWPPPALRYSPSYLAWQLSFPFEKLPPLSIAAFLEGRAVGFAAATPRMITSLSSHPREVMIVSFIAVDPIARQQGVGHGLYRELLGALRGREADVITFAQAGTAGDRLIHLSYPEAGYTLLAFGSYPVFATMTKSAPAAGDWEVVAADPPPHPSSFSDQTWLWSHPREVACAHYLRDPRSRRWLNLYRRTRPGEPPVGSAWAVNVEYSTPTGHKLVPSLETVWLPREHVGGLSALARAAASLGSEPDPQIVMAPNLAYFPTADLRQAGFRQTPTQFQCYLATLRVDAGLTRSSGTNLEIV